MREKAEEGEKKAKQAKQEVQLLIHKLASKVETVKKRKLRRKNKTDSSLLIKLLFGLIDVF